MILELSFQSWMKDNIWVSFFVILFYFRNKEWKLSWGDEIHIT